MKVLFINVFRAADFPDCTNNGLSARVSNAELFMDCSHPEAIEWCKEHHKDPAKQFILINRRLWGEDHSYAEPLIKPSNRMQVFGGNFLYTSDSRMYKTGGVAKLPIPIHDRFETYEEFDALSR